MEANCVEEARISTECPIFGANCRYSLINLCPERLVPIFLDVREHMPKMLQLPEHCIRKKIKPSEQDDRIRLAFWDEYNSAWPQQRRMKLENVIRGCCSYKLWMNTYERDRHKLLWIMTPPKSFSVAMKQIMHQGLDRLLEVVSLPIINSITGKIDIDAIGQVLNVMQVIDGHLGSRTF